MAKLPKSVQIGPAVYSVSNDEREFLAACHEERSDLLGCCKYRENRIVIRPDQGASSLRDTLLHECLHAVFDGCGLGPELGTEDEEKLIGRLTAPLLDLLRRNPKLVAALVAP